MVSKNIGMVVLVYMIIDEFVERFSVSLICFLLFICLRPWEIEGWLINEMDLCIFVVLNHLFMFWNDGWWGFSQVSNYQSTLGWLIIEIRKFRKSKINFIYLYVWKIRGAWAISILEFKIASAIEKKIKTFICF